MATKNTRNLKLGLFVIAGSAFLVIALYLIGNKQNLFGSTIRLNAKFYNANGLMTGNSVRFAGISIGTIESVDIISDSMVSVSMFIEKDVVKHIKKNAIASIGTDGLMGNKIVNIKNDGGSAEAVVDGDELRTFRALDVGDMMQTLNVTNENIKVITTDLKKITSKLKNSNSLWNILSDTTMGDNLKRAMVAIRITGENTALVAGDLRHILSGLKKGEGSLGALLTDTSLSGRINQSVVNIQKISDEVAVVTGDLRHITTGIKNGEGAVGTLLNDTAFVHNLNQSMKSLSTGTEGFSQNMEALKHSFLMRKYFKKQEKQKKK